MSILRKTLTYLFEDSDCGRRRVVDVTLNCHNTQIELDEGSLGFAMSYARIPKVVRGLLRDQLLRNTAHDPCLVTTLFDARKKCRNPSRPAVELEALYGSLGLALVSALSARRLRGDGDRFFGATHHHPPDFFKRFSRAIVIGFGGYLEHFVCAPTIRHIQVVDLIFAARPHYFTYLLDSYRQRFPETQIVVSDQASVVARPDKSEIVAITGSAMTNGTMEQLLSHFEGRFIVVNGGSAAIYPRALFQRGVRLINTMIRYRAGGVELTESGSQETASPGFVSEWKYFFPR